MSGPKVVIVPLHDHRLEASDNALWNATGALIALSLASKRNPDRTFSIMLSRITREMHRHYGRAAAETALRQFTDSMAEAATGDPP